MSKEFLMVLISPLKSLANRVDFKSFQQPAYHTTQHENHNSHSPVKPPPFRLVVHGYDDVPQENHRYLRPHKNRLTSCCVIC